MAIDSSEKTLLDGIIQCISAAVKDFDTLWIRLRKVDRGVMDYKIWFTVEKDSLTYFDCSVPGDVVPLSLALLKHYNETEFAQRLITMRPGQEPEIERSLEEGEADRIWDKIFESRSYGGKQ